jgi:hypothetical protein
MNYLKLNKWLRHDDLLFLIVLPCICDTFCTIIVLVSFTTCKILTFLPMSSSSSMVEFALLFAESTDELLCLCPLSIEDESHACLEVGPYFYKS